MSLLHSNGLRFPTFPPPQLGKTAYPTPGTPIHQVQANALCICVSISNTPLA